MTIPELEEYFKSVTLPESIKLGPGVKINNVKDFIDSHFTVLKHHGDKSAYQGFYYRLMKLKEILDVKI